VERRGLSVVDVEQRMMGWARSPHMARYTSASQGYLAKSSRRGGKCMRMIRAMRSRCYITSHFCSVLMGDETVVIRSRGSYTLAKSLFLRTVAILL